MYRPRARHPEAPKGLGVPNVIVGLGGLLSDPACCVLKHGQIASAVEQAKVSRQDRAGSFPDEAFRLALEVAGVKADEIDCVALARPFAAGPESVAQLELRARFPNSEIVVTSIIMRTPHPPTTRRVSNRLRS